MKGKPSLLGLLGAMTVGCAPKAPPATAVRLAAPPAQSHRAPVEAQSRPSLTPAVVLVEPYLVPVAAPAYPAPPTLRGHIFPQTPLSEVPVLPPPTTAEPALPPPTTIQPPATTPKSVPLVPVVPSGVVRLFEEERSRRVDDARQRLAAATARATQASGEAKRLWSFVKEGFVAQKQAEVADASAKDALAQQSDAQRAVDEAQRRLKDVRRDLETAAKRVALAHEGFRVAQTTVSAKAFQAVPNLFRLAVLGQGPTTISLQGGTLGRRLDPAPGEAGAWLVRTVAPSRLRVGVGSRPTTVLVRSLPLPEDRPKV